MPIIAIAEEDFDTAKLDALCEEIVRRRRKTTTASLEEKYYQRDIGVSKFDSI